MAPEPLAPRVQLREGPPARVAAIRCSGTWSQANYEEHLEKLRSALRAAKIASTGEPTLSRRYGPMTPWFMRRNEIWLTVDGPER
ncbi:MAG: heme-binding protein [Burkholderiales bacterium]|nr:heme-binding protein [Burkholderiales bacterium]